MSHQEDEGRSEALGGGGQETRDKRLLEGRVAQVLNERELAINIGRESGVRARMRFKVLADSKLVIRDPTTGAVLGAVERDKARVEATQVFDNFSICRTYIFETVGGMDLGSSMRVMFGPTRRIYESLEAESEAYAVPLSQEESRVKIGDVVRQLLKSEDF